MKTSKRPHFIQRFKFDVEIERKEDAHRIQNELSSLFRNRIERMLDRILTEYDDPRYVTRISTIEVDLGDLGETGWTEEFMQRFERRFRRQLEQRLSEVRHPSAAVSKERGEQILLKPAQIEILSYFLLHGRMPIGAEGLAGKVEKLFNDLLSDSPGELLETLKLVAQNSASALRRLSKEFSDKLVARIYRLATNSGSSAVASYERRVTEVLAQRLGRSSKVIQAEVRFGILQYLLIDIPSIFTTDKMEEALAKYLVGQYGEQAENLFKDQPKRKVRKSSKDEQDKSKRRDIALEIIENALKRRARQEDPVAIIEAWEFLVSYDVQALRRLIAQKATNAAALEDLTGIVPAEAIRDFVQRAATTNGVRMLQLAASVLSAHDLFQSGGLAHEQAVQAVYAALIHTIALDATGTPSPKRMLEAIQAHLKVTPSAPPELIEDWDKFDFLADLSEPVAKEKQGKTPRQLTEEERIKEEKEAAEELRRLAEEERKRPPMSQSERKRAAEQAKIEAEAAKRRQETFEKQLAEELDRAQVPENEEGELVEDDAEFYRRGRERERLLRGGKAFQGEAPSTDEEAIPAEPEIEELFETPVISTGAAMADIVIYYLATGQAPWWARRFMPQHVLVLLRNLLTREPAALREAFTRMARALPASQQATFVQRLLNTLEEKILSDTVAEFNPDLAGFVSSVAIMLEEAMKMAPEGVSLPSSDQERKKFKYTQQVAYLLTYAGSSPNAAQMLRFVLREIASVTSLSPKQTIEWIGKVLDSLVERGERRFVPLKAMLPKVFEGLTVAPPQPQERSLESLAYERSILRDPATATELPALLERTPTSQVEDKQPVTDPETTPATEQEHPKDKPEDGQETLPESPESPESPNHRNLLKISRNASMRSAARASWKSAANWRRLSKASPRQGWNTCRCSFPRRNWWSWA